MSERERGILFHRDLSQQTKEKGGARKQLHEIRWKETRKHPKYPGEKKVERKGPVPRSENEHFKKLFEKKKGRPRENRQWGGGVWGFKTDIRKKNEVKG